MADLVGCKMKHCRNSCFSSDDDPKCVTGRVVGKFFYITIEKGLGFRALYRQNDPDHKYGDTLATSKGDPEPSRRTGAKAP